MTKVESTEEDLLLIAQDWATGGDANETEAVVREWPMRYGVVMLWCIFWYSSAVDRTERAASPAW
jgi:hypothetical protein